MDVDGYEKIVNIVGKGENAGNKPITFVLQCLYLPYQKKKKNAVKMLPFQGVFFAENISIYLCERLELFLFLLTLYLICQF